MSISISHVWKPSLRDLQALATNAIASEAIARMPLLKRRARLLEFGYPRHLYKYRVIPSKGDADGRVRLEQMLLGNELYASTSERFNDPFDAQADYRIEERGEALRALICEYLRGIGAEEDFVRAAAADDAVVGNPEAFEQMMKDNHLRLRNQLGVCCLAATADDPLLWAHYAQSHRGIAVQYQPSRDPKAMQPHPVEYSPHYPIITNFFDKNQRDVFSPLLRKAPSWFYEREWRILRPDQPNRAFQVRPEALTGVLLGMRIEPEDRDYIRSLVVEREKRFGLKTRVFQAEAAPGTYNVRFRRLRGDGTPGKSTVV